MQSIQSKQRQQSKSNLYVLSQPITSLFQPERIQIISLLCCSGKRLESDLIFPKIRFMFSLDLFFLMRTLSFNVNDVIIMVFYFRVKISTLKETSRSGETKYHDTQMVFVLDQSEPTKRNINQSRRLNWETIWEPSSVHLPHGFVRNWGPFRKGLQINERFGLLIRRYRKRNGVKQRMFLDFLCQ